MDDLPIGAEGAGAIAGGLALLGVVARELFGWLRAKTAADAEHADALGARVDALAERMTARDTLQSDRTHALEVAVAGLTAEHRASREHVAESLRRIETAVVAARDAWRQ